jgi:hypothetical protein
MIKAEDSTKVKPYNAWDKTLESKPIYSVRVLFILWLGDRGAINCDIHTRIYVYINININVKKGNESLLYVIKYLYVYVNALLLTTGQCYYWLLLMHVIV